MDVSHESTVPERMTDLTEYRWYGRRVGNLLDDIRRCRLIITKRFSTLMGKSVYPKIKYWALVW